MTTETIREAVARAIYAKLEVSAFLPYEELADAEFAACISEEDVSHEFLDSIAADVIRTVLERLREIKFGFRDDGMVIHEVRGEPNDVWQDMLDAATRGVG